MKKINPNGVVALAKDAEYLTEFVDSLGVPILRENLDELQQTVQLMQADNTDEFYDISTRNKKYGRVDAMNGPVLLEKCSALPQFGLIEMLTKKQAHAHRSESRKNRQVFTAFLEIRKEVLRPIRQY